MVDSDKKSVHVSIRMSADEKAMLAANAEQAGLTISEYVKRCAFGRVIKPRMPRADVEAIATLGRLGGLVKQIFSREVVDPQATYDVLSAIKKAIGELRNDS